MTVLFKSFFVYDCDLLTPRELSYFVAHEMTQCVAPWWGLLGIRNWGETHLLGASSCRSGVSQVITVRV